MPQWLSAILTALTAVVVGAGITWWVGRGKERRDGNKDKREEGADDRDEESEAVAAQRSIAVDALERTKVAYQRLDIAEASVTALRAELETLRPLRQQRIDDVELIAELRRRNRALDNDLKRLLSRRRQDIDDEGSRLDQRREAMDDEENGL